MSRPGSRIPYQPTSRSQKQAILFRVQFSPCMVFVDLRIAARSV